jgi:hypothetical protein
MTCQSVPAMPVTRAASSSLQSRPHRTHLILLTRLSAAPIVTHAPLVCFLITPLSVYQSVHASTSEAFTRSSRDYAKHREDTANSLSVIGPERFTA